MKLETLKPAKGSTKSRKIIGRGTGSGRGGTSTRGHKGAKSRSGFSKKSGFEGGQMPLQRRVPKFGFKNLNRIDYKVINLSDVQKLIDNKSINEFNLETFISNGLCSKNDLVKLLANGNLSSKVDIKVNAYSQKAKEIVESLGGTIEIL